MSETLTGGCACGAVRYRAMVRSFDADLCHCRMCQKATGSVSIALTNVKQRDVTWESRPDWYASSPIARRPYCARCGTSLGFQFLEGSENMDLTVASFDDPSRFVPTTAFGVESRHEAWLDTRALPGQRSDEYEALVKKWADAGVEMPK